MELYAPGKDITSTWIGCSYATISGTSMASPHVAGVAALVRLLPAPVHARVWPRLLEREGQ